MLSVRQTQAHYIWEVIITNNELCWKWIQSQEQNNSTVPWLSFSSMRTLRFPNTKLQEGLTGAYPISKWKVLLFLILGHSVLLAETHPFLPIDPCSREWMSNHPFVPRKKCHVKKLSLFFADGQNLLCYLGILVLYLNDFSNKWTAKACAWTNVQ